MSKIATAKANISRVTNSTTFKVATFVVAPVVVAIAAVHIANKMETEPYED